jgi:hypothetical protein
MRKALVDGDFTLFEFGLTAFLSLASGRLLSESAEAFLLSTCSTS